PGLLAVFDEPWHESGGLAETIEARVALTSDPSKDPAQTNDHYFEFGPDPIVSVKINNQLSRAWDTSTPNGDSIVSVPWNGMTGPVGHSFDATNQAALFTATSFIIPMPQIAGEGATPTDRRWYFAKLQFRRALINSVTAAPGAALKYEIKDAVRGPYSDPVW